MAKVLKDTELLDIVSRVIEGNIIDGAESYMRFLEQLTSLLCDFLRGKAGKADYLNDKLGYTVCVRADDNLPSDGGLWKDYDTDITWKDGKEI